MAAELSQNMLLAVPLAPLAGAIVAGLFGKVVGRRGAHSVAILGVLIAFILSAMTLKAVALDGARFNETIYTWMQLGDLKMEVGFLIDGLSAMMMCVVTFVSLMVHIYTIGYMEEDPGYQRFFSYISLFTFSMLMLVMSNNFLQLFFGWEAVGLVSYLLIGFWYTDAANGDLRAHARPSSSTRVGDYGFMAIAHRSRAVARCSARSNYRRGDRSRSRTSRSSCSRVRSRMLITAIAACCLLGRCGRQVVLSCRCTTWLPDAMAGPTPVSRR